MAWFATALLLLATVATLHAGYSTIHYQHLQFVESGQSSNDVPVDVLIELVAALVLGLVGALASTDSMVPLLSGTADLPDSQKFSSAASGFKVLNHRGPAVARLRGGPATQRF